MKIEITYITDDGKIFDNIFEAKKHECELTDHKWEFYNENMGLQSEFNNKTRLKLCKNCQNQEVIWS